MKFKTILFFLFLDLFAGAQTDSMSVEGNYQGRNLFLQNPLIDSNEFCLIRMRVNDAVIKNELNSAAVEIRLDTMNLKVGDSLKIIFYHHSHCTPRILHDNYHPVPTFEIKEISIDSTGLLKWNTKNEQGSLVYIIEQFVWNKWIKIAEVKGDGKYSDNQYSYPVSLHSGENKIRVKQNEGGKVRLSVPVSVISKKEKPSLLKHTVGDEIEFTREVRFEIYDQYGKLKLSGVADIVDISDLPKGAYYLNFESESTEFVKE